VSAAPEASPRLYRAGDGESLVLVHGFTATWRCWKPLVADLVPRFEVIAPTLHGHDGGPEPPAAARSLGDAADHFESLLDELGVGAAHFVGNSMGGALALEMAKRGRARSVVAISPGGGWEEADTAEAERVIRWFARTQKLARAAAPYTPWLMRRPGIRRIALRDVMARGDQVPPEDAVALARSSLRCTVVDEVFEAIRSGSARCVDLDRIDCPVMVIWGDRDRILPMKYHAGRFRREIPNVDFRVLRGVGHTPMWDAPGLLSRTIAQFAAAAEERQRAAVSASVA
jgi:pimeloyl-ACP methyl ester carboxylesterase